MVDTVVSVTVLVVFFGALVLNVLRHRPRAVRAQALAVPRSELETRIARLLLAAECAADWFAQFSDEEVEATGGPGEPCGVNIATTIKDELRAAARAVRMGVGAAGIWRCAGCGRRYQARAARPCLDCGNAVEPVDQRERALSKLDEVAQRLERCTCGVGRAIAEELKAEGLA